MKLHLSPTLCLSLLASFSLTSYATEHGVTGNATLPADIADLVDNDSLLLDGSTSTLTFSDEDALTLSLSQISVTNSSQLSLSVSASNQVSIDTLTVDDSSSLSGITVGSGAALTIGSDITMTGSLSVTGELNLSSTDAETGKTTYYNFTKSTTGGGTMGVLTAGDVTINTGTLNLSSGSYIAGTLSGSLDNTCKGHLNITASSTDSVSTVTYINALNSAGIMNIYMRSAGTLIIDSSVYLSASLQLLGEGSSLEIYSGSSIKSLTSTNSNVTIKALDADDVSSANTITSVSGDIQNLSMLSTGSLTIASTITVTDTLVNEGSLTLASGSSISTLSGGADGVGGAITFSSGTADSSIGSIEGSLTKLTNSSTGTLTIESDLLVSVSISNSGTLNLSSTSDEGTVYYDITKSSTYISLGTVIAGNVSFATGTGTINAGSYIAGTLSGDYNSTAGAGHLQINALEEGDAESTTYINSISSNGIINIHINTAGNVIFDSAIKVSSALNLNGEGSSVQMDNGSTITTLNSTNSNLTFNLADSDDDTSLTSITNLNGTVNDLTLNSTGTLSVTSTAVTMTGILTSYGTLDIANGLTLQGAIISLAEGMGMSVTETADSLTCTITVLDGANALITENLTLDIDLTESQLALVESGAGVSVNLEGLSDAIDLTGQSVTINFSDGSGSYTYVASDLAASSGSLAVSFGDSIPEPSSATLSLFALTALLARRRRRAA